MTRSEPWLIQYFIGLRCSHEILDLISMSDDAEAPNSARKGVVAAMHRGNWMVLHSIRSSQYAASMLTDCFTQMTTTSSNTNVLLIGMTSLMDYISKAVTVRSKRVSVDAFLTVRNMMLRLFHHDCYRFGRQEIRTA
jgi:hypothetical protein